MTYATRLKVVRDASSGTIELKYAYFESGNKADLARMFLWVLDTHFGIIQVFARVLEGAIKHDKKKWELRYNAFEARLIVQKKRWQPLIGRS